MYTIYRYTIIDEGDDEDFLERGEKKGEREVEKEALELAEQLDKEEMSKPPEKRSLGSIVHLVYDKNDRRVN